MPRPQGIEKDLSRIESEIQNIRKEFFADLQDAFKEARQQIKSIADESVLTKGRLEDFIEETEKKVGSIPASIDEKFRKTYRHYITFPALVVLLSVASTIISIISVDFISERFGHVLVDSAKLEKVLSDKITRASDDQKDNALALAILKIVNEDLSSQTVIDVNKLLSQIVERDLQDSEVTEPFNKSFLTLVKEDITNARTINIVDYLNQRKNDNNFDIFRTEKLADAVNEFQDRLKIFDNRISVSFAYQEQISYQDELQSNYSMNFFADPTHNRVIVRCHFTFQSSQTIPRNVRFYLPHLETPVHEFSPNGRDRNQQRVFELNRAMLSEAEQGGLYSLRLNLPPRNEHLRLPELDVPPDPERPAEPDLLANCFVSLIGDAREDPVPSGMVLALPPEEEVQ